MVDHNSLYWPCRYCNRGGNIWCFMWFWASSVELC